MKNYYSDNSFEKTFEDNFEKNLKKKFEMRVKEKREENSKDKIEKLNLDSKRVLKNEIEISNSNSNKIDALIVSMNNFISINLLIMIEKSFMLDS